MLQTGALTACTRHARFEDGIFAIEIGEAVAVEIFPDILRGGLLG
jgi:hypothetical protein